MQLPAVAISEFVCVGYLVRFSVILGTRDTCERVVVESMRARVREGLLRTAGVFQQTNAGVKERFR